MWGLASGSTGSRPRTLDRPVNARKGSDHLASTPHVDDPLRIALLTYRGKKHCGGQGVYVRHLSKALTLLGHHVEVLSGPPYPETVDEVPLVELPSLEIYNDHFPMRMPAVWELKNWTDVVEVLSFSSGTFPEPLAFSLRAWDHLKHRVDEFDIVQDNQSMGYGLLAIEQAGLPVLGTIHHPITVDRKLEMEHAETPYQRFAKGRWYAFTKMQSRVAQRLTRILTVSESSRGDIIKDHGVDPERLHVVPVGVDPETFLPVPGVTPVPGRIITTASADVAMKGLVYLLEAVAKLRTENPDIHLVVVGKPKEEGRTARTLAELGWELPITPAAMFNLPGNPAGFAQYGRFDNPTWEAVEHMLSHLEDAPAIAFPSGMAAISAVFFSQLKSGDRILLPSDGYYTTRVLAQLKRTGADGVTAATVKPADASLFDPVSGLPSS